MAKTHKMSKPQCKKYCVVPKCVNTTTNAPEKMFFTVPMDLEMRKKWIEVMNRAEAFGAKSTLYCCEDHFDIENDMENYIKYKLVGGMKKLKKGVVPHKFECQKGKNDKPVKSAVRKQVLKNIRVVVDQIEIFTCKMSSFCKQSFLNIKDYRLHEISHTQKDVNQTLLSCNRNGTDRFIKRFKCKECGLKFVKENTLTAHSILHEPFAHVCDCGIGFYQKTDLILHKQLVHPLELEWEPKINLKPDTNKLVNPTESVKLKPKQSTTLLPTITVDLKTVSEEMPTNENNQFYCPICKKVLASKRGVQAHLITHTEEKPYKCEKCNKGYIQYKSLVAHLNKHTRIKELKCKFCDKVFYDLSLLQLHQLTHIGDKPYVCSYCEKTFSSRSAMNRHSRIHTGDKTKQCHVCMKPFYSPYELKRHIMTVHDKVKRFECDVCNKKFPEKTTLRKHYSNIHLGIKKYECDYCGMKQACKYNLKMHVLKFHMNSESCIDRCIDKPLV